ncbi:hypothetical protein N658DRAFT_327136 [Parathielavia hyrcaniae]|uniref:Uncharacterized protein n=1 Tax=Parathielavia hyrcaniae TaxID=113614 RepID=A0AAN6T3M0_9PEZI|nr:hypothetical protein N658DRAFT_327136 [Parathielavia hyrcaniae]
MAPARFFIHRERDKRAAVKRGANRPKTYHNHRHHNGRPGSGAAAGAHEAAVSAASTASGAHMAPCSEHLLQPCPDRGEDGTRWRNNCHSISDRNGIGAQGPIASTGQDIPSARCRTLPTERPSHPCATTSLLTTTSMLRVAERGSQCSAAAMAVFHHGSCMFPPRSSRPCHRLLSLLPSFSCLRPLIKCL